MRYVSRAPEGSLAGLVDYLWALSDSPSHARERILPTGTLELVLNLSADQFHVFDGSGATLGLSGAVVSGARRRSFVVDTRDHASLVGVRFKPGGAFPLLPASPGEIGDAHVELRDLWGTRAGDLRQELCAAASIGECFSILERELGEHVADRTPRHPAVQIALSLLQTPATTVREVAARVGLSGRRLTEVFRTEVGVTPKWFQRVHRFQSAVALARQCVTIDWGRIARRAGYYDQSHLIQDFEEFAALSPVELARSATVPVKDDHLAVRT